MIKIVNPVRERGSYGVNMPKLKFQNSSSSTNETQKIESHSSLDEYVRQIYEPRYGRSLSDKEVWEIRFNLRTFAEGILKIAERLKSKEAL